MTSLSPLVVGFGENSIDYVYRVARHAEAGTPFSKVAIEHHQTRPGGQVATTLAACARLGFATRYLGSFGDDDAGTVVREALANRGVDVSHALTRRATNRYAVIVVDRTGERVVLWQRDPALRVTAAEVQPEWLAGAALVHVDATDEDAAIAVAREARRRNLPITCDLDEVTPHTGDLLEAVTVPIVAEAVPGRLTGEPDVERALRAMKRPHHAAVVVTLGAHGAAMLDKERFVHDAGFRVDAVDTTGAGDVFRAAFICALLRGQTGEVALRFANAAAAVSCTRPGTMASVPTPEDVDAILGEDPPEPAGPLRPPV